MKYIIIAFVALYGCQNKVKKTPFLMEIYSKDFVDASCSKVNSIDRAYNLEVNEICVDSLRLFSSKDKILNQKILNQFNKHKLKFKVKGTDNRLLIKFYYKDSSIITFSNYGGYQKNFWVLNDSLLIEPNSQILKMIKQNISVKDFCSCKEIDVKNLLKIVPK